MLAAGRGGRCRWFIALALGGGLLGGPVLAAGPLSAGGARVWDDGQVYREMGSVVRNLHGLRRVPDARLAEAAARAAREARAAWPQVRHVLRSRGEEATAARFEQALADLAAAAEGGEAALVRRALGRTLAALRDVEAVLRRPMVDPVRAARAGAALTLLSLGFALLFARTAPRRLAASGPEPVEAGMPAAGG